MSEKKGIGKMEHCKIIAVGDNVCDKYLSRGKMYPGGQCVNHGFHFQLELFFYALLFFTKHKNVIDRDIDVSLMIFSTYILPNLRCVNNHYSLFLFFL